MVAECLRLVWRPIRLCGRATPRRGGVRWARVCGPRWAQIKLAAPLRAYGLFASRRAKPKPPSGRSDFLETLAHGLAGRAQFGRDFLPAEALFQKAENGTV